MKYLVLAALFAAALARPQEDVLELSDYGILRMSSSQDENGNFQYSYETTDPAAQDVSGQLKQIGEESGTVQQGQYSFTTQDENGNDVQVTISWTADENGFQAQGDAIPQAPEDPNAAAQAAAYEKFSQLVQQRK